MQALSAVSTNPQAFRAGLELGMALSGLAPEVVFLFSSVHYADSNDLLQGLYEGLERDDVVVLGGTGDGCFAMGQFDEFGVSALGLNSGGEVRWHLGLAPGVGVAPAAATRAALAEATAAMSGRTPALYYVLADFRADAAEIERVLEHEVSVPAVGGLALDQGRMHRCALYAGRECLSDHVLVLAVDGPLRFDIVVANTIEPIGRAGIVEQAEGVDLHRIDGVSAREFLERETGQAILSSDEGTVPLTVTDPDDPQVRRVRSVLGGFGGAGRRDDSLTLFAGIAAGKQVQPGIASPAALLGEVGQCAAGLRARGANAVAALVVSCAGRKLLLGAHIAGEAGLLAQAFDHPLPLAGFASAGEVGPVRTSRGYSRNLFHNMAFVMLLINP